MKKRTFPILLLFILLTLVGCGNQNLESTAAADTNKMDPAAESETGNPDTSEVTSRSINDTDENSTTEELTDTDSDRRDGKTLIAYFTWADNTHVENPEEVDVDATTSASVLWPGNVGLIAGWLQEETGADLFSIQVEELYSSDYDECLDRASEEEADNARPALATHVENMEQYDTIYLGYPKMEYGINCVSCAFSEKRWEYRYRRHS